MPIPPRTHGTANHPIVPSKIRIIVESPGSARPCASLGQHVPDHDRAARTSHWAASSDPTRWQPSSHSTMGPSKSCAPPHRGGPGFSLRLPALAARPFPHDPCRRNPPLHPAARIRAVAAWRAMRRHRRRITCVQPHILLCHRSIPTIAPCPSSCPMPPCVRARSICHVLLLDLQHPATPRPRDRHASHHGSCGKAAAATEACAGWSLPPRNSGPPGVLKTKPRPRCTVRPPRLIVIRCCRPYTSLQTSPHCRSGCGTRRPRHRGERLAHAGLSGRLRADTDPRGTSHVAGRSASGQARRRKTTQEDTAALPKKGVLAAVARGPCRGGVIIVVVV